MLAVDLVKIVDWGLYLTTGKVIDDIGDVLEFLGTCYTMGSN
jgi:hypothetical protein